MLDLRLQSFERRSRSEQFELIFLGGQKSRICVDLYRETAKRLASPHAPAMENARAPIQGGAAGALLMRSVLRYMASNSGRIRPAGPVTVQSTKPDTGVASTFTSITLAPVDFARPMRPAAG